ncbi:TetR/AcrR family transcriptional regulator [Hyphobacterium sp. HN65]|uniref:TetR/AcrR family transcriptional regulator n=1 Tax=Hyphobacterium lacteum TaxID=3116575 RepID=A0ABU7LQ43_9PROT|nr:TetR/AcrR family transcriptional regulator [Hyphobacterium sp. HN65]MEE2526026.1 TetR/AcrR family transcriptional regulator [Hyphobacterium sp. HN65]
MNSHFNPTAVRIIPPTQKRGREMQARLVEATLELLENQSFEEISIADITGQAGVAVGTFYRRFTAKEALLPLLYEVYNQRVEKWFAAMMSDPAFESPDREIRVRAVIGHILALFENNRGLVRALHLNSRVDDRIVPDNANPSRQNVYRAMAELIFQENPTEAERRVADAMVLICVSTSVEYVLYPKQTPTVLLPVSRAELVDALTISSLALFAQV